MINRMLGRSSSGSKDVEASNARTAALSRIAQQEDRLRRLKLLDAQVSTIHVERRRKQ